MWLKEHLKLKTQQKTSKSMQGLLLKQVYQKVKKIILLSLFSLKENYWNNRSSIEMMVKDIQFEMDIQLWDQEHKPNKKYKGKGVINEEFNWG